MDLEKEGMDLDQQAEQLKSEGNDLFKNGKYYPAIEKYTKAINLNPENASYYANRAACYLQIEKFKQCIEDCNRCLQYDNSFVKALKRRAKSYMSIGQIEMAIQDNEASLKLDPKSTDALQEIKECKQVQKNLSQIDVSLKNQKWTEAISYINMVLRVCPKFEHIQLKQLECQIQMGNYDKAQSIITNLQESLGNNNDFLYLRGIYYYYSGNAANALKVFQEILRQDPDNSKSAVFFKKIKKIESLKEQDLQNIVRLQGKLSILIGNTYLKEGQYQDAYDAYTQAMQLDDQNNKMNSILYSNRAQSLMKQSKFIEAKNDCNKSIELNPDYSKAYLKRASINEELEEWEQAINDYNKLKQLDPNTNVNHLIKECKKKEKMAKRKDFYKILEVDKNASQADIKKAYKKQALRWHPDKNNESEEKRSEAEKKFKDIAEAYSVLTDPKKKERFDSGMDIDGNDMDGFGGGGVDPSDIFSMFFGGGGMGGMGGMGGQGQRMHFKFG